MPAVASCRCLAPPQPARHPVLPLATPVRPLAAWRCKPLKL